MRQTEQRQKRALKDGGCNSVLLQDEDGQGLTDEEIQAEANTFMFAGEPVCKYFLQETVMLGYLKLHATVQHLATGEQ